ncbi:hypothetical protein ONZ45_g17648 [Pleurotus djamor]|nr:hypothetical protein ONZ45_g17648 [Pleurotus djamor]
MKHVVISGWIFQDLEHFISLMGTNINTTLESLEFENNIFRIHATAPRRRQDQGRLIHLDTLIVDMHFGCLDAWFESLVHAVVVRSLHLRRDWSKITPLISRFGEELEELALIDNRDEYRTAFVDLSRSIRLKQYSLRFNSCDVLSQQLKSIPEGGQLETLDILDVDWNDQRCLIRLFKFLNTFLVSERFVRLEKVILNCPSAPTTDEFEVVNQYFGQMVDSAKLYIRITSTGEMVPSAQIREYVPKVELVDFPLFL